MLKRIVLGLLLGGAVVAVGAPPVLAQCDLDGEVRRALTLIEKATEIVERSGIPEARELLEAARSRTREAVDRGRRGEREFACRLAAVGQSLARKAAEVAQRGLRLLEQLEHMLQKTDEHLREAAQLLEESGSAEARRFLDAARKQQQEAWSAFRSRRARLAVKLTLMAREAADRATRLGEEKGKGGARIVERELDRTDRLLEETARVLDEADPDPNATQALTAAQRLQTQARRQFRREHPQLALRLTRQARALARRALSRSEIQLQASDVETLIGTTEALVEELAQGVAESGNQRARRLLSRAETLLDDARKALDDGRLRPAVSSARAASALALDVSDLLERGDEE
jgi:hypothetical protein